MKRFLTAAACAAALCAGSAAQAGLVTFNDPGAIVIDGATDIATYTENGFTLSGPATSFLTLGDALVGGFDTTPFSLRAVGGGEFSLLALDFSFYDLGFGDPPGNLSLVGFFGGSQVAQTSFGLGTAGSPVFGSAWARVTEVRFSGTTGFAVDNISAVPEPSTLALTSCGLALGAMLAARGRRRRV